MELLAVFLILRPGHGIAPFATAATATIGNSSPFAACIVITFTYLASSSSSLEENAGHLDSSSTQALD
jgi:hypothetical protein